MSLSLYSKASTDTLLAAKLDLAGGTMTGALTLSASGIIFSDSTYLTTAPAGSTLAADQLTAGVVAANPTTGPTTAGDVLQYNGTGLVWAAGGGSFLPLAGGAMDTDAEVTIATTSDRDSLLAGWGLGVQKTSDITKGTTVSFDGLDTYDGSSHMIISPTGITFPDSTTMTTAPAGSTLAADQLTAGVVATNPTAGPTTAGDVLQYDGTDLIWAAGGGGVAWGSITGTLSSQTDLQTELDGKLQVRSVNAVTTSYTLVSTDANNIVYTTTSPIIIPKDATYSFPVGTVIIVCTDSSSNTVESEDTFLAEPGINGLSPSATIGYGAHLVKVAANSWRVF